MKKLSAFLVAGLLLEFGGYALRQETGLQLLPTLDSVAFAAEERKRRKARRVPNISEMTFRRLAQAQELMDLKEYDALFGVSLHSAVHPSHSFPETVFAKSLDKRPVAADRWGFQLKSSVNPHNSTQTNTNLEILTKFTFFYAERMVGGTSCACGATCP